jgi:hypothetical protein
MANVDKAFGLKPLGNLSATGAQKQYGYNIDDSQAGAIFQGDLVTIVNGSVVKFLPGTHAAALGVFNGCNYVDPTTGKPIFSNYYPGSVNITQGVIQADVIDDPNQLFIIQADASVVQANIGKNADVIGSGGSTTTGVSTMELNSATIADTAALNLKIVGFYNVPNNEPGAFAVVVVKINEHLYGSTGVKAVT